MADKMTLHMQYRDGNLDRVQAFADGEPDTKVRARGLLRSEGQPFVAAEVGSVMMFLSVEQARAMAESLLDAADKVAPLDLRPITRAVG